MSEMVTREKSPRVGIGTLLMQTMNGQKGPKTTVLLRWFTERSCVKIIKKCKMCSDCKDFKMMKS